MVEGEECSNSSILVQVVHEICGHSLSQLPQALPHYTVGKRARCFELGMFTKLHAPIQSLLILGKENTVESWAEVWKLTYVEMYVICLHFDKFSTLAQFYRALFPIKGVIGMVHIDWQAHLIF